MFPNDFFEFCLSSDPSLVFVVTQGTNVVGSIIAQQMGQEGYVSMFCIDKPHRGQGLGKKLLTLMIDQMKTKGI